METETPAPRRRLFVLLPLLVFLGLAGLFLSQLLSGRDVSEIPSALFGRRRRRPTCRRSKEPVCRGSIRKRSPAK